MLLDALLWLIPAFLLTSTLYAVAGFGGGSTYLALLSLTTLAVGELRFTALLCNLLVTGGTCWVAWRAGWLRRDLLIPLFVTSVPLAFLGGRIELPRGTFLLVLSVVLLVAGGLMLRPKTSGPIPLRLRFSASGFSALGGGLGFVSGVLGIGGGILLSPWLFLRERLEARYVAATTAAFIFVNSLAGLTGQISAGGWPNWGLALPLLLTVLVGGQIGTRLGLQRLPAVWIRRLAAGLIIAVGIRIAWQQLAGTLAS